MADFEAVARGRKKVTLEDLEILGDRDREKTIFEALRDIFKARSIRQAKMALNGLGKDVNEVMLWVDENIPREYEGQDVWRAYDALSLADVFRGRISRRQDWSLLRYVIDLTTIGVGMAKSKHYSKFVGYRPPKYLQMMFRHRASRETLQGLLRKVARVTHSSIRTAFSYLPVLKASVLQGKALIELSEAEVELLRRL